MAENSNTPNTEGDFIESLKNIHSEDELLQQHPHHFVEYSVTQKPFLEWKASKLENITKTHTTPQHTDYPNLLNLTPRGKNGSSFNKGVF